MTKCRNRMKSAVLPVAVTVILFAASTASAAIWIGGASGDMNTAANWDSDITASGATMMFTNNCTVTLSDDLIANSAFSDATKNTGDSVRRYDKDVTINLNGRTLRTNSASKQYWRARGSTLTFTGGTFLNVQDGGATNMICADNANMSYGMSLIVTGSGTKFVSSFENKALSNKNGTRFVLKDRAQAFGNTYAFGDTYSTNSISGGASLTLADGMCVGAVSRSLFSYANNYGIHDVIMTISRSTLTIATNLLCVGHGFLNTKTGYGNGNCNNRLFVENGSTVSVNELGVGTYGANSNNVMFVTGEGTTLVVADRTDIGTGNANSSVCGVGLYNSLVISNRAAATFSKNVYIPNWSAASENRLVLSDGAYALFKGALQIGATGTNNAVVVRSGARIESVNNSIVYLGINADYGSRIEIDGGHLAFTNEIRVGSSGYKGAHEIFVGNGGSLHTKTLVFNGIGDRLVVSNGTVSVTTFNTGNSGALGTVVRVMGESSSVSFDTFKHNEEYPHCAPVFEFSIPERGWIAAPIKCTRSFSLPADVTLRIDEKSVAAYLQTNPRGGTIPLMRTGSTSRAITVADMDALSANLPDGCSLVNESGVLSVKIKKRLGFTVIVF